MIRPLLIQAALFLLPFAAYAVFLWATRAGAVDPTTWSYKALGWLTGAAFALIIVSFVIMAQFGGAPPNSTYVPAHMEDGRLVPGRTQ